MRFFTLLALPLLAASAPLARRDAADTANGFTTSLNQFAALFLNSATGAKVADLTQHATLLLGLQRVQAFDNLADDACVGQQQQGGVCQEAAAWAASMIYAGEQQLSMTAFAQYVGSDRIARFNALLQQVCIGPDEEATNPCSKLFANADLFANAALDVPDPGGHSNPYTLSQAGILILLDNAAAFVTGSGANPGP